MKIKLYYTPKTRAVRPRWLLEELEQPYELQTIDVFGGEGESEAYKRINPYGTVPAAEIDGQLMLESGAMCHWLADRFPEKHLAPSLEQADRIPYERFMSYAVATLEPPVWLMLVHSEILPEPLRVPEIIPWATKRYLYFLKKLEAEFGNGPWLLGDQFTAADIMVGSTLMWMPDQLEKFKKLAAYIQRLQTRPAYQRCLAE